VISHRYKCIFIHIPRSGGSSIEDVIWSAGERTEANLWMGFIRPMHNKYQTGGLQHLLARQVRDEVGRETFAQYFKFTLVRNPWDKAVSQFNYTMQTRPDLRQFAGISDHASFEEYLDRIRAVPHVQWKRQVEFLYDQNGELLLDMVGRFESFDADASAVFERLGIKIAAIPHVNRAVRPEKPVYSNEARDLIAEHYADDIKAFGYTCPWTI
jgi:hypothetical protein